MLNAHNTHCCTTHGCKYGDRDCPVAAGKESGIWCEDCEEFAQRLRVKVKQGIDVFPFVDNTRKPDRQTLQLLNTIYTHLEYDQICDLIDDLLAYQNSDLTIDQHRDLVLDQHRDLVLDQHRDLVLDQLRDQYSDQPTDL